MVTIPSRHLGMEIARSSSCTPSTTPKAPSITVRPVSQLAHAQPSIILQSNPSAPSGAAAAAAATAAAATATAATAADLAGIKSLIPTVPTTTNPPTLTLNAMHALGPDSAFGTGGLLLTFNRSLPAFTTANPTPALVTSTVSGSLLSTSSNKTDIGPVSAQLAAKTNHIADMVNRLNDPLLLRLKMRQNSILKHLNWTNAGSKLAGNVTERGQPGRQFRSDHCSTSIGFRTSSIQPPEGNGRNEKDAGNATGYCRGGQEEYPGRSSASLWNRETSRRGRSQEETVVRPMQPRSHFLLLLEHCLLRLSVSTIALAQTHGHLCQCQSERGIFAGKRCKSGSWWHHSSAFTTKTTPGEFVLSLFS